MPTPKLLEIRSEIETQILRDRTQGIFQRAVVLLAKQYSVLFSSEDRFRDFLVPLYYKNEGAGFSPYDRETLLGKEYKENYFEETGIPLTKAPWNDICDDVIDTIDELTPDDVVNIIRKADFSSFASAISPAINRFELDDGELAYKFNTNIIRNECPNFRERYYDEDGNLDDKMLKQDCANVMGARNTMYGHFGAETALFSEWNRQMKVVIRFCEVLKTDKIKREYNNLISFYEDTIKMSRGICFPVYEVVSRDFPITSLKQLFAKDEWVRIEDDYIFAPSKAYIEDEIERNTPAALLKPFEDKKAAPLKTFDGYQSGTPLTPQQESEIITNSVVILDETVLENPVFIQKFFRKHNVQTVCLKATRETLLKKTLEYQKTKNPALKSAETAYYYLKDYLYINRTCREVKGVQTVEELTKNSPNTRFLLLTAENREISSPYALSGVYCNDESIVITKEEGVKTNA